MPSPWADALGRTLDQSLDLLGAAIRDCPDDLWEAPMWLVDPLPPGHQFLGADWQPITDPAQRATLARRWLERRSAPWSVAWHALEVLDYDLNGESAAWMPPAPFAGHPHWRDLPALPAAWPRADLLGYVDYCRRQVLDTMAIMTDERAATPLPAAHRHSGQPYASIATGLLLHTTEHAVQIRQFITPRP